MYKRGKMSNYGPKKLNLYNKADNARRTSRNTNSTMIDSTKTKEKCYSTRVGQMSSKQQADLESDKYSKLNKKQPVKVFTKEEIAALYGKMA